MHGVDKIESMLEKNITNEESLGIADIHKRRVDN
jgi:hypothetical protein